MTPTQVARFAGRSPAYALLICADSRLSTEVERVAAAAAIELHILTSEPSRPEWTAAPIVLLHAAEGDCVGLPRRSGVVVVTNCEPNVRDWQAAARVGSSQVLSLPDDADRLLQLIAGVERNRVAAGHVVAVTGGRGGVGASVFACSLATAATARGRSRPVVLVDVDQFGGGLDYLLGIWREPGLRWPELNVQNGNLLAAELLRELPTVRVGRGHEFTVLSARVDGLGAKCDSRAIVSLVDALRSQGADVVLDVPRRADPIGEAALRAADTACVVLTADSRTIASARGWVDFIKQRTSCGLVVRGPSPAGLSARRVASAIDLPLWAAFRPESQLANAIARECFTPNRFRELMAGAERTWAHLDVDRERAVA